MANRYKLIHSGKEVTALAAASGSDKDKFVHTNATTGALEYSSPSGSGDVVGPSSAVDSNFAAFDTTTGKLIKDSGKKSSDFQPAGTYATGTGSASGTNTGDQDLSGLVPKTTTVNTKALSGNIVLNPDDLDDTSTTHKFVSAAQLTVLGNTSGTNTGDSATNTTSNTYADGKVADTINDGTTTVAPSQNAVFDALALKLSKDANGNATVPNFIQGFRTQPTAGGTTTLVVGDAYQQVFTGSSTQTVKLPTTGIIVGQSYQIINNSSQILTIESSNSNTVSFLAPGTYGVFTALTDTPTTIAHWNPIYYGVRVLPNKKLTVNNTITFNGTDDTTITFPTTDSTLAKTTDIPVKATGAEIDTGTDDAKFATAKAIADSHNVPHVVPGTSGNVLTSNGTDWTSAAPSGGITYVEGTFTPTVTLIGGTGNVTPVYSTNIGRYTRIGRKIFVDVLLDGDGGAEGAGTGQINIALPITSSTSSTGKEYVVGERVNSATQNILVGLISTSSSTISLSAQSNISSYIPLTGAMQSEVVRTIRLNFNYEV